MNGTSGFREVRSTTSRSPSNRLLREQRSQFKTGSWQLPCIHNLVALSTWAQQTSAARTIGFLVVTQVWLLSLGLESFAQTVSLEGLEVTQSIQSMSLIHPEYNNQVPMIANKRTMVRAYFNSTGTVALVSGTLKAMPNPCPVNVNCDIPSVNSIPVTVSSGGNGNLRAKRDNFTKSLNFELPPNLTLPGTVTLTLDQVAGPGGTAITCTGCTGSPVMVTFRSSPPLLLRLIGLKYERPTGTWFEPREEDFALITSWLKRAYPVAEVEQPLQYRMVPYSTLYGDLFEDEDGDGKVDEDAQTCMYANRQIQAIRSSELAPFPSLFHPLSRAHYYGLIYDGGPPGYPNFIEGCSAGLPTNEPDTSITAAGPTGPAGNVGPPEWDWDTDGSYGDWYAAHELGHTFGRLHLVAGGCTTNAQNDIDTTVDGRISPNPPPEPYYVGFDSGDRVTLPSGQIITIPRSAFGGDAYDIMTHCNPYKWINPYTYEGVRERLAVGNAPLRLVDLASSVGDSNSEDQLAAFKRCMEGTTDPARLTRCSQQVFARTDAAAGMQVLQGKFLNILGIVNFKNRTGRIDQVDQVNYIVTRPQAQDERVQIRVTYEDGKVINYPVEIRVNINTQPDKRTLGLFNTPILLTKNIASIELVMVGKSVGERENALDTIKVTKNPPLVDEITTPNYETQAAFFKGPLALTWKGHDEDSKTLTYTVQFSSDKGGPWQTLGIGLTKSALALEPKMFKHLREVKIKVIASDRFNKGEKIAPFNIPAK